MVARVVWDDEVAGSSPVVPIRENKKWGKEMRMSVCLTQPINRAVIVIVSVIFHHLSLSLCNPIEL